LPVNPEEGPPVILYQGTLNQGRGLERMITAMPFIPVVKLIIAGDGPLRRSLMTLAASLDLNERIQFTGMLPPEKLQEITRSASVGISIEEPLGLSYISCLPNKLFDYIQAGVPVLVSGFPEMRAIVEQYQIGMVLEDRAPEKMASILNFMLHDPVKRRVWKENLARAAEELCWERESVKLKRIIDLELFS
jgi:glycosyltransferase involved in cell wall biosynthesis